MPSKCPHCGSELWFSNETVEMYDCATHVNAGSISRGNPCRIREAIALCERYSAGNEPGAHALANKVREILTGERREYV